MSIGAGITAVFVLALSSAIGIWTASVVSNDPEWSVSAMTIDLGDLPMMSTVHAAINVTNHGSVRSLTLEQVDSDCGCIVAQSSDRTIGPGGESRIDAFVTTDVFAGALSQRVTITTSRGEEKEIRIRGLVIAPFPERVAYAESVTLEADHLYEGIIVGAVCFAGTSRDPLPSRWDWLSRSLTIEVGERCDRLEIVLDMEGAEVEQMTRRVELE